jgi:hypothetical protein
MRRDELQLWEGFAFKKPVVNPHAPAVPVPAVVVQSLHEVAVAKLVVNPVQYG